MQVAQKDKTVEGIIFNLAMPDTDKQLLELVAHVMEAEFAVDLYPEIMNADIGINITRTDRERVLCDDLKAHVF